MPEWAHEDAIVEDVDLAELGDGLDVLQETFDRFFEKVVTKYSQARMQWCWCWKKEDSKADVDQVSDTHSAASQKNDTLTAQSETKVELIFLRCPVRTTSLPAKLLMLSDRKVSTSKSQDSLSERRTRRLRPDLDLDRRRLCRQRLRIMTQAKKPCDIEA